MKPLSDSTSYRCITTDGIAVESFRNRQHLIVESSVLEILTAEAFHDVNFFFRTRHLESFERILRDESSTRNDRTVAAALLRNAIVSAAGVLPSCQDTGTATVVGWKGQEVSIDGDDSEALSAGVCQAYRENAFRFSQMAPLNLFEEANTGTNLPAQIDLYAVEGDEYHFLFVAKGGGSSNKTALYQESKALLNETTLKTFLREKLQKIGVAACPPYHLAIVIGGTSPEMNLKYVKLASTGFCDGLPSVGNKEGDIFRDLEAEDWVMEIARELGLGAQFGGPHFALDARVLRAPRHAGSCPVGIGVSCSADRNIRGKVTGDGAFLEELDREPERFLPLVKDVSSGEPVQVDLNRPMDEIREELRDYPVGTLFALSGPLTVARDIAHARIHNELAAGQPMPESFCAHPVYYAGPARTPDGYASGSFGPTTAQRMDPYIDEFMRKGGSFVMLGKGNRAESLTAACNKHGGFYLGTIGGTAALLAKEHITGSEIVAYEDLGMEAIRRIIVKDLPAFLICDDKGNCLYDQLVR